MMHARADGRGIAAQSTTRATPRVVFAARAHLARRVPSATYRLQFNRHFRLRDAEALVDYFHALGITDLYASPLTMASPSSLHGYDVTDYSRLNPEIGDEDDLARLSAALSRRGMSLLLDIVPNHMGIGDVSNRWWQDVLENGPSSPFAKYFDIDWTPPKAELENKILLPVLGGQFGRTLESGQLRVSIEDGAVIVTYFERRFPTDSSSWPRLLQPVCEAMRAANPQTDAELVELESITTALTHLPARTDTDPERVRERQREKEVIKRRLAALLEQNGEAARRLRDAIERLNGRPGDSRSFDALEAFVDAQVYRLCYWQVASDEINYRRFFDVNELAAIRVDVPEVFDAVHALPLRWLANGWISGLRIDHPDGLFDPEQYFRDVQHACARAAGGEPPQDAANAAPHYVVVEKILTGDEQLRDDWMVHGTVGYDAMKWLTGLLVDPRGRHGLTEWYRQLTGVQQRFGDAAYDGKRLMVSAVMSSELHVLSRRLDRISEQHRASRDFTLASLQRALGEVIACFPVYRTYIRAASGTVSDEDRRTIVAAIRAAIRRNPAMSSAIFRFIASVLLLEDPEGLSDAQRAERREFVMRFQQITGPVMAKGMEDTACYRVFPLACLNEVGGDPERFAVSVESFHRANAARLARWPASMVATSTHDTKRGEDVRARMAVLSEVPDAWRQAVAQWRLMNRHAVADIDGVPSPDANDEYLFYQTLVGVWPLGPLDDAGHGQWVERVEHYMHKAIKEAKVHTSWVNPDDDYERAVRDFVRRTLRRDPGNTFLSHFGAFHARIARAGALNALSQVVLKLTMPGVPDCYQGSELWDFNLVDPDNRRPVDFAARVRALDALGPSASADKVRQLLDGWVDGRIKLYTITHLLRQRTAEPAVWLTGDYVPLRVAGPRARHVCAFARVAGRHWRIVVVPRLPMGLGAERAWPLGASVWSGTRVLVPARAPKTWTHALTATTLSTNDRALPLSEVFRDAPVALLSAEAAASPDGPT